MLSTAAEVAEGRLLTLDILREVFQRKGNSVREIMGRCRNLTDKQIEKLRAHLDAVKKAARQPRPAEVQRKVSEVAVLMS